MAMGEAVEHMGEYYSCTMRRAAQSTRSSDAIPTHQTLELLAFDEKSTFDCFCFIWAYKATRALC
jgi:hypothetical protein